MKPIAINGRFLSQPLTGVQRFARELVLALDDLLTCKEISSAQGAVELLAPPGTLNPLPLHSIQFRAAGHFQGHIWEQLELPRLCRNKLLFTPGGGAPFFHPNHLFTVADAGPFSTPRSYTRVYGLWHRSLLRRAARIPGLRFLTVSEFSRQELSDHLAIAPSRITVIPEGHEHALAIPADPVVLTRLGLNRTPYIFAVGSANPNKNFRGLIHAFQRLRAQLPREHAERLRLVLTGRADSRIFSHASISGEAICHTGYIGDGELRALYENATCFVMPSFYEGFGLPLLEAMAHGCAVACSISASLPKVGGDAVLYFDPHSPQEMADAIGSLLLNPALREKLASRGLERARQFRWRDAARQMWEALPSG